MVGPLLWEQVCAGSSPVYSTTASLAQLVEQNPVKIEVGGSWPSGSAKMAL